MSRFRAQLFATRFHSLMSRFRAQLFATRFHSLMRRFRAQLFATPFHFLMSRFRAQLFATRFCHSRRQWQTDKTRKFILPTEQNVSEETLRLFLGHDQTVQLHITQTVSLSVLVCFDILSYFSVDYVGLFSRTSDRTTHTRD
jgi:hypothetical protein